jgi:hypothetical protein
MRETFINNVHLDEPCPLVGSDMKIISHAKDSENDQ